MNQPRKLLFPALLLAASACADVPTAGLDPRAPASAPVLHAASGGIPGHYIVLLKEPARRGRRAEMVRRVEMETGVRAERRYTALGAFAARLSDDQVQALRRDRRVRYIEQDRRIGLATTQTLVDSAIWGLDRIDQLSLPLSGTYTYDRTGAGVNAYIIDTGVFLTHFQFGTRAQAGYDALRLPTDSAYATDCNGHGTHVAGVVGGVTYGVAKGVALHSVRVLDCNADGTLATLLDGIDWVIDNHAAPAVANLSLNSYSSSVLNYAVEQLVAAGVFTVAAAGNNARSACVESPASAANAYTVAASTSSDAIATFSNHGSCVDGYAPGVSVRSAYVHPLYPNNRGWTEVLSGTSMAAPHVAGTAALLLEGWPTKTPAEVTDWINGNSAVNKITNNPLGTPNRLVNKRWL